MTKNNIIRTCGAALILTSTISTADQSLCGITEQGFNEFTCETFNENSNTITKLTLKQEPPHATELDNLPTIIISSNSQKKLNNSLNPQHPQPPYNNYLQLPRAEEISSITTPPQGAQKKIQPLNWKASNMKTVTYRGTDTIDGVTLVCITLKKTTKYRSIAILQCNNFYPKDIQKLKALANKIDNQKNQ